MKVTGMKTQGSVLLKEASINEPTLESLKSTLQKLIS